MACCAMQRQCKIYKMHTVYDDDYDDDSGGRIDDGSGDGGNCTTNSETMSVASNSIICHYVVVYNSSV